MYICMIISSLLIFFTQYKVELLYSHICYVVCSSVAVTRSKDVPPFGPSIPEGATFNKGKDFADFLIVKGETGVLQKKK